MQKWPMTYIYNENRKGLRDTKEVNLHKALELLRWNNGYVLINWGHELSFYRSILWPKYLTFTNYCNWEKKKKWDREINRIISWCPKEPKHWVTDNIKHDFNLRMTHKTLAVLCHGYIISLCKCKWNFKAKSLFFFFSTYSCQIVSWRSWIKCNTQRYFKSWAQVSQHHNSWSWDTCYAAKKYINTVA